MLLHGVKRNEEKINCLSYKTANKKRDENVDVLKEFNFVQFAIMKINIRYKPSFIWFHLALNNH